MNEPSSPPAAVEGSGVTAVDQGAFRRALGRYATGIAVMTTLDPRKDPIGVTINAFSALSLEPPLVLFCLARDAVSFSTFAAAQAFAVNLLTAEQAALSERFARPEASDWQGVAYSRGRLGLPLIDACLATLECTVEGRLDGGDHCIFIGRVQSLSSRAGEPLVFYASRYRRLAAS